MPRSTLLSPQLRDIHRRFFPIICPVTSSLLITNQVYDDDLTADTVVSADQGPRLRPQVSFAKLLRVLYPAD